MSIILSRFPQYAFVCVLAALMSACHRSGSDSSSTLTPTTLAPTVTSTAPVDGATDVAVGATVSGTFNKLLDAATVGPGRLTVNVTGGAAVTGTVTLVGAVVTFTADADLASATQYTAILDGKIADPSGQLLGTNSTWTFTTVGAAVPAGVAEVIYSSFESPDVLRATSVDNVSVSGRALIADSATELAEYRTFWVSPDGTQIALIADEGLGVDELYLSPIDGSSLPVKVSGTIVTGGGIQKAVWSPDGMRLAFVGDKVINNFRELFVINSDGSNLINVSPMTANGVILNTVAWSPDGSKLVYIAEQVTPGVADLVISEADGTSTTVVVQPGGAEPDPNHVPAWSPDSARIAYARAALSLNILVVNADGSGALLLDMPINTFRLDDFAWAPDGSALVSSIGIQPPSFTPHDLYEHPTDGSPVTNITNVAFNRDVKEWHWAPDSSLILFSADLDALVFSEAYVIAPDGTGLLKLSPMTVNENDVERDTLAWSPDSQNVIFGQDPDNTGDENIYLVGRDGTGLLQLSNLIGQRMDAAVFSPDGSQVFFGDGGPGMIWVSALDGSSTVEVTDEFGTTSTSTFGTSAGAFQIVDGTGVTQLFDID